MGILSPLPALRLGFTSWLSQDLTLDGAFGYLSRAGCETVEVAGLPELIADGPGVKRSLSTHGLTPTAVSVGIPFVRDPVARSPFGRCLRQKGVGRVRPEVSRLWFGDRG